MLRRRSHRPGSNRVDQVQRRLVPHRVVEYRVVEVEDAVAARRIRRRDSPMGP